MASKRARKPKPDPAPIGYASDREGRNGGTLTPHPPGSNGGVHRGKDLLPLRRHLIRGLLLEHLARADMSLEDLKARRRKRCPAQGARRAFDLVAALPERTAVAFKKRVGKRSRKATWSFASTRPDTVIVLPSTDGIPLKFASLSSTASRIALSMVRLARLSFVVAT